MKKQVYEVDEEGYLLEVYVANVIDNKIIDDDKKDFILLEMPNGLFNPRWSGKQWVEGESEEEKAEREAQLALIEMQPTAEELANAEFEIKVIKLLSELEVF